MGAIPGDTLDSEALNKEKPRHSVEITTGFWMSRTAVTVAAYNENQGLNPWGEVVANAQPLAEDLLIVDLLADVLEAKRSDDLHDLKHHSQDCLCYLSESRKMGKVVLRAGNELEEGSPPLFGGFLCPQDRGTDVLRILYSLRPAPHSARHIGVVAP